MKSRKRKEPDYAFIAIEVDDYSVRVDAGINSSVLGSPRLIDNEEEPVHEFQTNLEITGLCTDPENRAGQRRLDGLIQLDDVYWGGEQQGGKRGRGSDNKVPFVAAVETNNEGHPIAMRMSKVQGFTNAEIEKWACKHVECTAVVVSDGLACFGAVVESGCTHYSVVTGGGPASVRLDDFTWVNTMIGNVKNALRGTYHAINGKHLPRYLAEFCFRFNRRYKLEDMLPRLGYAAARTPPMPFRFLRMAETH